MIEEVIVDILKLFCWRNWYIYMIQFVVFNNNIICVNKKFEFCKCTFIIQQ